MYTCRYCEKTTDSFSDAILHCSLDHPTRKLETAVEILDPQSGCFIQNILKFDIVPAQINDIYMICPNDIKETVTLTPKQNSVYDQSNKRRKLDVANNQDNFDSSKKAEENTTCILEALEKLKNEGLDVYMIKFFDCKRQFPTR